MELGPPVYFTPPPPVKARGGVIPVGDGADLPPRPAPTAHLQKRSVIPLVPTKEEISSLPRWAKVAFAAHTARRVLPAVRYFWKGAPAHHLQALDKAVRVTEHAAGDIGAAAAVHAAIVDAHGVADAVDPAAARAAADTTAYATAAITATYDATYHATYDAAGETRVVAEATAYAAAEAANVLFRTATIDTPLTAQLRCIRRDFVRLKRLARKEKWTDDTPVSAEVFGPMWPEGIVPYWAVEPPPGSPPAAANG